MIDIYKLRRALTICLSLLLCSCSQTVTLKVVVDVPAIRKSRQAVNFYLLDNKKQSVIEEIRSLNQEYFYKPLNDARDSLQNLNRERASKESAYRRLSSEIESNRRQLTVDYGKQLNIEIVRVQKFGDVWKFWAKINNQGLETIDGLYLTLTYEKSKLVNSGYYPVHLLPNQSGVADQINLDLSQNTPLMIRLSSHPAGFSELPKAIKCIIDSVKSDFNHYLEDSRVKLNILQNEMLEIGLKIDEYPAQKSTELQQRIASPINSVLESNLKELVTPQISKTYPDTIRYTDLKKGSYQIIAYTTPASVYQWHQNVNLNTDQLIKFTSKNYKQYFFKVSEQMIMTLPSQNDTPKKRK
ncbi:MAG: hypothetical protein WC611_01570 [Candidatus Neomarinimicrobiota bacterium]